MDINPVSSAAQQPLPESHAAGAKQRPTPKTVGQTAAQPKPIAQIDLAKHHMELHNAYAVAADSVNRVGIMIHGAQAIVREMKDRGVHTYFLSKFLRECQNLSEDLGGFLESERDSYLGDGQSKEGK